ncbi:hypothetical protein MMC09_003986 [Bachmanniomyces sp. S44760]|nr:hypothetical protein [Bachmanniomyces sp. S44760]
MGDSSSPSKVDTIPTYEESIQQGATATLPANPKNNAPASLAQQLADVRSHRVSAILAEYIDPLLQSQALAGLHKTTFVLVPSNVFASQASHSNIGQDVVEGSGDTVNFDSDDAIIGFPAADYVKLVRLHGDDYNLEFWRQQAVIAELDSVLKIHLQASGLNVVGSRSEEEVVSEPTVPEPVIAKKGFFRRGSKENKVPESPKQAPPLASGWKAIPEQQLDPGYVRVKTELKDISMRVTTAMGLYETNNGKAVILTVELGI